MADEYRWLIYMAGDNDLSTRIDADFQEISSAGRFLNASSVVVLADRFATPTQEVEFNSRGKSELKVGRGVNVNAGQAVTLADFLKRRKNGAKHHVACVWGHGYGWLTTAFAEAEQGETPLRNSRKAMVVASRGLFRDPVNETLRTANEPNIDESSRDFLDMEELRTALQLALEPKDQYAIIGCDACYMAMAEVAYELRNEGKYLVASEEEEEPGGWDYRGVFQQVKPGMSPKQVAKVIVEAYFPLTLEEPRSTLSAIKLDEMEKVAEALDKLGALLTPLIATKRFEAIKKARAAVHTFKLYHYIDLVHFAECLQAELRGDFAIEDATDDVIQAVQRAVVATMNGVLAANANGMAVYVPNEPVNAKYTELALAQAAPKWAEFVTTYGDNR